ncbi:DUF4157 domain-containing protein [Actinoplanes sp. NPDC051494]|uniref:DUF4157 domain-containing protein n=1 Tax=Actinoplanes sp. NPDC051494 TaxID=3363907 RepID=UPI0037B89A1A
MGNQAVEAMLTAQRSDHQHGAGCGHGGGEEFADPVGAQRAVSSVLSSAGQPLADNHRSKLENSFQTDLSGVREHRGAQAQRAAAMVNAHAFTVGQHIVYGKESPEIQAHEVTHTVAPVTSVGTDLGGGLGVTSPSHAGERLAAENGRRVAAGGPSAVTGPAQRREDDAH